MRLAIILVIILTIANIILQSGRVPQPPNGESWLITKVVSGQSVEAVRQDSNHKPTRVRLIGISAPLKAQTPWGDRARERLEQLVKDQTVLFEYDQDRQDSDDRPLVYIWQAKSLINAELVKEGYAIADSFPPNNKYEALLEQLQAQARLLEYGIWDPQNPMSLSPKEYRRQSLR
jgi:micrococcal nuclease